MRDNAHVGKGSPRIHGRSTGNCPWGCKRKELAPSIGRCLKTLIQRYLTPYNLIFNTNINSNCWSPPLTAPAIWVIRGQFRSTYPWSPLFFCCNGSHVQTFSKMAVLCHAGHRRHTDIEKTLDQRIVSLPYQHLRQPIDKPNCSPLI